MVAFYEIALLISFICNENTKRCKLITKKRLNNALPVLRIIKVMTTLANIVLRKVCTSKNL